MPKDDAKQIPIYHATKSLTVRYRFQSSTAENAAVVVAGANTHAILYAGCAGLLDARTETSSVKSINFATAAITFLYTDTTPEEGYLSENIEQVCYPLVIESHPDRILSSIDLYPDNSDYKDPTVQAKTPNKASRNHFFNQLLTQRVGAFANVAVKYQLPYGTISSITGLNAMIANTQFHETYHHSEQCAMHYLSSSVGIAALTNIASNVHAKYLYGIVLDIYTQLILCKNCNACLIGMQNSQQQGFLFTLKTSLEKHRIQTRTAGPMLSIRVSASRAPRSANLDPLHLPNDTKATHEVNPDIHIPVFQADNKVLGVQKIINDEKYSLATYPGAFLVSKQFANVNLEIKLKSLPAPAKPSLPKPKPRLILKAAVQTFSKEEKAAAAHIKSCCEIIHFKDPNLINSILEYCNLPISAMLKIG